MINVLITNADKRNNSQSQPNNELPCQTALYNRVKRTSFGNQIGLYNTWISTAIISAIGLQS